MAKRPPKSQKKAPSVKDYLEGLSPPELVSYVLELSRRSPEVQRDLEQRAVLAGSDAGGLLREARQELRSLASEKSWNDWEDRYEAADYKHVRSLFERLLAAGQVDALLDLGKELLEKATVYLEHSEEEETDEDLLACFTAVFQAVPLSSKPDLEKVLCLIDLSLADDYDLTEGMSFLFERQWPAAVWSAVADEMIRRLEGAAAVRTGDKLYPHKRQEMYDWLDQALEASGRESELLPLLEHEAVASGSYLQLVDTLIRAKRWDDASRWALEGLRKDNLNPNWSADTLRDRWRSVAEHRKEWATVAAMAADTFFSRPSTTTFRDLMKAAKQARCEESVRAAAVRFLELGGRPDGKAQPARKSPPTAKKATPAPSFGTWPLPALPREVLRNARFARDDAPGPHYDVLLGLALEDKQPDEVLRWYDRIAEMRKERNASTFGWVDFRSQVADAVAGTHPDRAVALYRDMIAQQLTVTKVSAYEAARPYLVKLKALLTKNKRVAEWARYLADLRKDHARKPRLIEVLDHVERGHSGR